MEHLLRQSIQELEYGLGDYKMSSFNGRREDEDVEANIRALNTIEAFKLLGISTDNLVTLSTGEIIFDSEGDLIESKP